MTERKMLPAQVTSARYLIGDTRDVVASLPDASVDLVLTSPPFLALRSYLPADHPDKGSEIGSEGTPAAFLAVLLELAQGWRRVLAPHGSICVELGDTYSGFGNGPDALKEGRNGSHDLARDPNVPKRSGAGWPLDKSLCMIPQLFAASLSYGRNLLEPTQQFEPWRVRNIVRWVRPNPPVGALGDKFRPATSEMTVACMSRTRWFDLDAVREAHKTADAITPPRVRGLKDDGYGSRASTDTGGNPAGAPPLDWWKIPTHPYPGSHYATWPPALCVKPIKAMCPERVCRVCGEPSRRIVGEAEYVPSATNRGGVMVADAERVGEGVNGWRGANGAGNASMTRTAPTLGWTDCGCSTDGTHWRAGVVLDPFGGSGTTGMVATGLGRDAILIDLDARNADLARDRIGMFMESA